MYELLLFSLIYVSSSSSLPRDDLFVFVAPLNVGCFRSGKMEWRIWTEGRTYCKQSSRNTCTTGPTHIG
jgi:hypothetical protein